jgi:hypothetical protein
MSFLGLRKRVEKNYTVYKNDWMEFCTGFSKWNFRISPASYFDNRAYISFSTIWGQFYLHIPFIRSKYDECDPPQYGFYFYGEGQWIPDTFVWCWKKKTYHFEMPWALNWYRTSKMRNDGKWESEFKPQRLGQRNKEFYDKDKWAGVFWEETYPYSYTLKSGEVQDVLATITIEEREWRRKWLMFTSLFNFVRTSISIEFSEEVGERRGSWKGGTLGCGYDLKKGETPLQCLRRMEREREFR